MRRTTESRNPAAGKHAAPPATDTLPPLRLGAHMSVAGGLHRAFERIREVEGTALQIFTRNQRTWTDASMDEAEVAAFREAWSDWGGYPVASHAAYLINLASPKAEVLEKSVPSLGRELYRCARLGVPFAVLHPGAPQEMGPEAGIDAIARGLDAAFDLAAHDLEKDDVTAHAEPMVLLEITAGQGSSLGSTFAELAAIIGAAAQGERLGICLDTCHAFAAGYDVATPAGLERTLDDMATAGLAERLHFIHLNDSKTPLGSRKDRHTHIGEGEIGRDGFAGIVNNPFLRRIPMVIETPKGENLEHDHTNLRTLRKLAGMADRTDTPRRRGDGRG